MVTLATFCSFEFKLLRREGMPRAPARFCVFSIVVPDEELTIMGCANGVILYLESQIIPGNMQPEVVYKPFGRPNSQWTLRLRGRKSSKLVPSSLYPYAAGTAVSLRVPSPHTHPHTPTAT